MKKRLLIPLVVLTLSAASVLGSGSYKGKGRRPPDRLEATQYNLGKKIFTVKAELPEPAAELVTEQTEELTTLQSLLPDKARARTDLTALAGRLDDEQFEALTYYVSVRYKVEVPE